MSFRHPSSRQMYRSYRSDEMESASPVYGFCGRRSNYLLGAGILLALIGASLLVAFGLLYVQPYIDIQHLVQSECTTEKTKLGDTVSCTCASDASGSCTSRYPCIHITVNYTTESDDVILNATVYDSYETYVLQESGQQVNRLVAFDVTICVFTKAGVAFTMFHHALTISPCVCVCVYEQTKKKHVVWCSVDCHISGCEYFCMECLFVPPSRQNLVSSVTV